MDYISSLVPLLEDKRYTLSSAGEALVKEQAAVAMKVASKGRPDVTLYFDKVSGLLLKTEHRRRDSATNKDVLHEEFFSAYQEVNPAQLEERTLKAAKVNSDDSALLELLRKQTVSDEARKQIKELIRDLGKTKL